MFTSQRRPIPAISLTPRGTDTQRSGTFSKKSNFGGKGKAVAPAENQTPPLLPVTSLLEANGLARGEVGESEDDWRGFREAGLLDEATMERKEREALIRRASKLEQELFDYQYNMGLLLIEKKEWTSKFEELRQALEETQEILKREQSAHLIALTDVEKREENLRRALSMEKQCVANLEKAVHDTEEECAKVKLNSKKKLTDANTLVVGIEEKSLVVEEKMHAAEAKIAEVNRKNSELETKLQELEAQESVLQRERLSLITEQEARKAMFYKQREDLQEWEMKLRKGDEMLIELKRTIFQREENANKKDRILKQKARDLEEWEKKIDLSNTKLKEREDDMNKQLADIVAKEREVNSLRRTLEVKNKELLTLEEKLTARGRVEIQKLVDDQKGILDAKRLEFERELEERRKSVDEEMRSKVTTLEQKAFEIKHKEEKLGKQEQALDEKSVRVKEKEKDLEARLKSVKETEKILKTAEKNLGFEKQQLIADTESLEILKSDIDKLEAETSEQEFQIQKERQKLKLIEEERSEHRHLQSELKQQIELFRRQQELLLKEHEDLKQERVRFEKEWEGLDEKRDEISKELKNIPEAVQKLEKLQHSGEDRLKEEESALRDYIQRELEDIRLKKESFKAMMKHDQLHLSEKAQNECKKMREEYEMQKINHESDMLNRQERMEKDLQERKRAFYEKKDRELSELNHLKEVTENELQEIRSKRDELERQKQEVKMNKKNLKEQQLGMSKDIDELDIICRRHYHNQKQFKHEKERFLEFVEKQKGCKNCGEMTKEFVLSHVQLPDVEDGGALPLPTLAGRYLGKLQGDIVAPYDSNTERSHGLNLGYEDAGGRMSWLRKCTSRIFSISPIKKTVHVSTSVSVEEQPQSPVPANKQKKTEGSGLLLSKEARACKIPEDESQPSFRMANDSFDFQQLQSDSTIKELDDEYAPSADDHSYMDGKAQDIPEDSQQSELRSARRKPGRRPKSLSNRTRSVKAVVEDAKMFPAESPEGAELNANMQPYKDNQGISSHTEEAAGGTSRKRRRSQASKITESEQDGADSDGPSDIVTAGGRRKRQQTVIPAQPAPAEKRYNLRQHKTVGTAVPAQALATLVASDLNKTRKMVAEGTSVVEAVPNPGDASVLSLGIASENGKSTQLVQLTAVGGVEFSQDRVVQFKSTEDIVDDNVGDQKSTENAELSEVDGTPEYVDEGENGSTILEEDNDDYDNSDDSDHPGEPSIGKKLWKFFTS
ncbi:nuclear matrix constituent protein 1-like isoform X2 [Mangifera indica]|uniref:nuclear matrix constituent protein 1-like isoform X2 n=1 Tax=Mangifera indica TaxID=29780 RepID=UPI001CFA4219|nr:nuclear matrix constituent protein 1-like isoform X2 [Mangifera indica]